MKKTYQRPKRLGAKLREIRASLGLSQRQMLDLIDFKDHHHAFASAWERGYREPPLIALLRYAQAAGISTDVLINDELNLPSPRHNHYANTAPILIVSNDRSDRNWPICGSADQFILEQERILYKETLAKTNGNKSRAARLLGLDRGTFRSRLKKLQICDSVDQFTSEQESALYKETLAKANGNKSEAARLLGFKRSTFRSRLKKRGIPH